MNVNNKYSRDFIWRTFKEKNYQYTSESKLVDLKIQAAKMADYIISAGIAPSSLKRELSVEEKHAKIFSLSLKVVQQFKNFEGEVEISKSSISQNGDKKAPFIKLFGSEAKFYVLKSRNTLPDHYGIIALRALGEGAHNAAHLVYGLDQGECVLRSLKNEVLTDKTRLERWTSDYTVHQKLLKLGIPGIVNIHEVFLLDRKDMPLVRSTLMEKCEGDLNQICGKVSSIEAKKIMKQILMTISQMHANGFVHGDLKPGNILYINSKEGVITKLGDFETTERASKGWSGTNTPEYVTPHGWCRGNIGPENTKKQDCFALGLIALQLEKGAIFPSIVKKYRAKLLENNALINLLNKFIHREIESDELIDQLSEIYPGVPEFSEILDEDALEMLNEKNSKENYQEIFDKCHDAIIHFEFERAWDESIKHILNYLLVVDPSPYHSLIAQLLNPEDSSRMTAQEALAKLNAIIDQGCR